MILRLRAKQQPRLKGRSPQLTNQTQTYSAAKYKSVFFIDVKSLPRDCLWKKRKIASDSLCQYFNLCMVTIVKVKKKIQLVMMLCGKFRLGQCRWFGRATIWFFSSKYQKLITPLTKLFCILWHSFWLFLKILLKRLWKSFCLMRMQFK